MTVIDFLLQIWTAIPQHIDTAIGTVVGLGGIWTAVHQSGRNRNRAWLGVSFRWGERLSELWPLPDGRRETAIYVSNFGQVPTPDVRFKGECRILPDKLGNRAINKLMKAVPEGPDFTTPRISNQGAQPLYFRLRSADSITTVPAGHRLYAYGKVAYDGRKHWTTFCVYWCPGKPPGERWENASQYREQR